MDFDRDFRDFIEGGKDLRDVIEILQRNVLGGEIWVIGGTVYNFLASKFSGAIGQGILKNRPDYDFLLEFPKKRISFPGDWREEKTSFGEPRFFKGELGVDAIPLVNVETIKREGLEPNIWNYFRGCFFDVQCVAYGINDGKIIGQGINALRRRVTRVNNRKYLEEYCEMKGVAVDYYADRLRENLGIAVEF